MESAAYPLSNPTTSRDTHLSFLYLLARRVLELVALRFRSRRSKDLEIVVLRHQLAILRRPIARPELADTDRVCRPGRGVPAGPPPALVDFLRDAGNPASLAPPPASPPLDLCPTRPGSPGD